MNFKIFPLLDLKRLTVDGLKTHKDEVWEYFKMVKRVVEYKELDDNGN